MDITRALHDAENIFRDYLEMVFCRQYGGDWHQEAGIPERITKKWDMKQMEHEKESLDQTSNESLIQFAEFNDLQEIINNNWVKELEETFGDKDILISYLKILEGYRNPDVRRRELFIYQKHLLLGITGEIRNKISIALSKLDTNKEVFPRIESAKDNLGSLWKPGDPRKIKTNKVLRVGDEVEIIIAATDPLEGDLEYRIFGKKWSTNNILLHEIKDNMMGKDHTLHVTIRSKRKYHAYPRGYDDRVSFVYDVVPRQS